MDTYCEKENKDVAKLEKPSCCSGNLREKEQEDETNEINELLDRINAEIDAERKRREKTVASLRRI